MQADPQRVVLYSMIVGRYIPILKLGGLQSKMPKFREKVGKCRYMILT